MIPRLADAASGGSGHRRRPSAAWIVLVLVSALAGSTLLVVALHRMEPSPSHSVEDRVRAIASSLRCPVCQSLSVADSPSRVAREMRATIARRLRAGDTPSQIRQGFVSSYGEWILLAPPRRGINWVVWLLPPLILVGGFVVAIRAARRWLVAPSADAEVPELSPEERRLLRGALEAMEAEAE